MTSVPRTVPSTPLWVIASSRQIIRNEAAMKSPRKHHGAQAPVLSIHFRNELKGHSLARSRGRAKAVLKIPHHTQGQFMKDKRQGRSKVG